MNIDTDWIAPVSETPRTITIYALKENQRPIGLAPWPESETERVESETLRKRKRKKRKQ